MEEEILNQINAKLDSILQLLKPSCMRPSASNADPSALLISADGSCKGMLRALAEPNQWGSGKGAFIFAKADGSMSDITYSVGITYNVANKVSPGYFPRKGDVFAISGRYEEKNIDGKIYRTIFAYTISAPETEAGRTEPMPVSTPPTHETLSVARQTATNPTAEDDDIPF